MKVFSSAFFVLSLLIATGCADEGSESLNGGISMVSKVVVEISSRIGTPLVRGDKIYFGTESGSLYAMDMGTGRERWRFDAQGAVFHPPTIAGDTLVFGSQDGWLRALDVDSGKLLWQFQAGRVDREVRDIFVNGTPAVVDGVIYFSSEDFNLYAVDLADGHEIWQLNLGEEPQAREIPIVGGSAYVGAWDGLLHAVDIVTGQELWRSQIDDTNRVERSEQVPFVTVVPIVTDEAIYFTDWAGNLFAVAPGTGEQLWRFKPGTANVRHAGSRSYFALYDEVLYYATLEDRHLYGVDRHTGEKVWQFETSGDVYGPRYLDDGIGLYVEFIRSSENDSVTSHLRALDFESKKILWTADDSGGVPSFHDGIVYYGGRDGTIHGRELRSGEETWRLGL